MARNVFAASSYKVAPHPVTLDFLWRANDTGTLDAYTGGGLKLMQAEPRGSRQRCGATADESWCSRAPATTVPAFRFAPRVQGDVSSAARNCSMDIDGDGRVLPTTDALILVGIARLSGVAVLNGTYHHNAQYLAAIRDYPEPVRHDTICAVITAQLADRSQFSFLFEIIAL